jgi:hypothetical protein
MPALVLPIGARRSRRGSLDTALRQLPPIRTQAAMCSTMRIPCTDRAGADLGPEAVAERMRAFQAQTRASYDGAVLAGAEVPQRSAASSRRRHGPRGRHRIGDAGTIVIKRPHRDQIVSHPLCRRRRPGRGVPDMSYLPATSGPVWPGPLPAAARMARSGPGRPTHGQRQVLLFSATRWHPLNRPRAPRASRLGARGWFGKRPKLPRTVLLPRGVVSDTCPFPAKTSPAQTAFGVHLGCRGKGSPAIGPPCHPSDDGCRSRR